MSEPEPIIRLVGVTKRFGSKVEVGGVTIDVPRPVLDRVSPPEDGQDWIRIDFNIGKLVEPAGD